MVSPQAAAEMPEATSKGSAKLAVEGVTIAYGSVPALSDVSLEVREHEIFGIIGPANAGKTPFLKALDRMDTVTDGMRVIGKIAFDGVPTDRVAFFLAGECVEVGETAEMVAGKIHDQRTYDYIQGRFA